MFVKSFKISDIKLLAIGHFAFHAINYIFDCILYPFVIYKTGIIVGYFVMVVLSAIACFLLLLIYDWFKMDLLGIEKAKELLEKFFQEIKDEARMSWKTKGKKILSKVLYKNKFLQFIFISIKFDPFISTIYFRKGYHNYNGFSKNDWKVFTGSLLISNAYWSIVSFIGVKVLIRMINAI